MTLANMVPWRKKKNGLAVKRDFEDVFDSFRSDMNGLMSRFFGDWGIEPFGSVESLGGDFIPHIDVSDDDKEVRITAELPGMDEKDIDVTLSKDSVTIKGEKSEETEDKGKNYYRSERRYGSFHRVIPLTAEIEEDKAEAKFKKGVLALKLPKTAEAVKQRKKIEVKAD